MRGLQRLGLEPFPGTQRQQPKLFPALRGPLVPEEEKTERGPRSILSSPKSPRHSGDLSCLGFPEADSETRIQIQAANLEGDAQKLYEVWGDREGKGTVFKPIRAADTWGFLLLPGEFLEVESTPLISCPSQEMRW